MSKPTATCKQAPGTFVPVINLNKCEGKGPCIEVCPYDVLKMHVLPVDQRQSLSLVGKLKSRFHDWNKARLDKPESCQACGLCVAACPEKAITLARVAASGQT